jgi:hypothetical protein
MSTVDVRDHSMVVADGRVVAWTECGPVDGVPVLRMPGTPGCRWTLRADRSPWTQRSLRVITTQRPGFGASSRLAGRGFSEHADDVAKILDHLDLMGLGLRRERRRPAHSGVRCLVSAAGTRCHRLGRRRSGERCRSQSRDNDPG